MSESNIPKKIHLIWFGDKAKFKFDIDGIKELMPSFDVKVWGEEDFNWDELMQIPYVKKAYNGKQWAFLSDYLRLLILNKEGGIFLDADMVITKSLEGMIDEGWESIFCFENPVMISMGFLAVKPNNVYIKQLMECYEYFTTGKYVMGNLLWTKIFRDNGFRINGKLFKDVKSNVIIFEYKKFSLGNKRLRTWKRSMQYGMHKHNYSWLGPISKISLKVVSPIIQRLPFVYYCGMPLFYWALDEIERSYIKK